MMTGNVVVVGSLNMDVVVKTSRFPVEGETILGEEVHFVPGGKGANQAVAAARLGVRTTMLGAVGEDAFGQTLLQSLHGSGVEVGHVKQVGGTATGIASIMLAPADNSIVVVPGANGTVTAADVQASEHVIAEADIVLVQLEIPMEAVESAVEAAWKHGVPVILNPAPARSLPKQLLGKAAYITPNRSELQTLTGVDLSSQPLEEAVDALLDMGPGCVVATLGAEGAAWKQRGGRLTMQQSYPVSVVDTTGAGDAFNGGLASCLAMGRSLADSVGYAVRVSALAVTKFGAQDGMPTREEVERFHTNVGEAAT